MTAPSDGVFPDLADTAPDPARMYDYCLGGKDNFAADRAAVLASVAHFPMGVDESRSNRQFLYRVVRFLARDAGIRQFLDFGSGLPTQNNVHQVAQQFRPDARVAYVDNDPIVLTHGRALLATDDCTTVIAADMTKPEEVLDHPHTRRLIDVAQPVAALFLSVGHSIPDDFTVESLLATVRAALVPGSYLAYTQMCADDPAMIEKSLRVAREQRYTFQVRPTADVARFLHGLELVEPGLVSVRDWRPDPTQPPLPPVDEPLRPYLGASASQAGPGVFGGVGRVSRRG